ncbi:DUF4142 domain-containing protein [Oxalobacter paraformigenes]|mgnify:CR=1 FL=1|uniref:DUF4142 domain-containing protein n=1 Tax=Oxalobacter paraformigenes TaxID=556268 RepID=C3X6U1_9BURK|nr:DUF4142 domain-containing protein [Oxalobacter paraformigenes]EEO26854.1 hypothetical protein OFAG_00007 [Oxalobacter paraformigenes]
MKKIITCLFLMVFGLGVSIAHAQNYNSAPEVASTLWAINKAEIETSKLAKNKTSSPAVLQFADQMFKEHQNAQNKLEKILKDNNINKISSADARTIRGEARKTMRILKKQEGIAFDRTFMNYQINAHKKALEIINGYILPRVQNAALKTYTLELKQHIENHLQEASRIGGTI